MYGDQLNSVEITNFNVLMFYSLIHWSIQELTFCIFFTL